MGKELSPSVKAWVEILEAVRVNARYTVAFREGVSWNKILTRTHVSPSLGVAFREGVSWNKMANVLSKDRKGGRLPWRRELKSDGQKWLNSNYGVAFREGVSWNDFLRNLSPDADPVAFREGVSWNDYMPKFQSPEERRLPWRRELKFSSSKISSSIALRRLPWRRELKSRTAIQRSCLIRRLPWRRELRILAFRPYKCAVIERL